jgi:hypothetical protein
MSQQKPSIGRIVHYVLPDGRHPGEVRAAIITRVWGDTCVNLQVFIDGKNDYDDPQNIDHTWKTSAILGSETQSGHWFWPPFVKPIPAHDGLASPNTL